VTEPTDPQRPLPTELERRIGRPLTPDERERLRATLEAQQREPRVPVQPEPAWRAALRRLWAFFVAAAGVLVKFGAVIFKAKFLFSIFITLGVYFLFWGWGFGLGVFLLILVHELGHMIEAKRQGLDPRPPRFMPFMAYVLHRRATSAYRGALVALAGPFVGALGAAACWGFGEIYDSNLLRAIAYFGFFLNLLNLLPFWILDGSHVADVVNPLILLVGALGLGAVAWRSHNFFLVFILAIVAYSLWGRWKTRPQRLRDPYYHVEDWQPAVITVLYAGLAVALILGMVATEVPRPT
jgi:Zn-dependent protease